MKLKLKHLTIALAAGALVAVLGLPDLADAGGHFGGGRGGGFGGGRSFGGMGARGMGGMGMRGMGGMGMRGPGAMGMRGMGMHGMGMRGTGAMPFPRSGMGHRSFGAAHGPRFYGQSFHAGAGHIETRSFNRSFPAARASTGISRVTPGAISNRTAGAAAIRRNAIATRNFGQLASNSSVRAAALTRPNAFFNNRFGGRGFYGGWRDGYGRWYGYRWWGAVFWPYWFGDYFSYAFWPYDYYDTYWGYGPDAILWGAFWPYGEFPYDDAYAYDSAYNGEIYRPYRRYVPTAPAADPAAASGTCSGFAPGVNELPIQELEKLVDGDEEQRAALNDVKAATVKASDILKESCSSETPLTPVSRLDAMQRRLQAMAEANEVVKGPLERLYGALSDVQKQRLDTLAHPNVRHVQTARAKDVNIGELCTSQAGFTNVPAERIASSIELTDAQKEELEKLKAASVKASDGLKASCPTAVPDTLDGRLDAAQQRVTALITAVDTVRPAVRDFYASLTDEQKAALSIQPGEKQTANNRG
jgi:hypothetical protein